MRITLGLLVLLAASPAAAEITSLGGFSRGQEPASGKGKKDTLLGCAGTAYPSLGQDKKVTRVRFEPSDCGSKLAEALGKELKTPPLVNAGGDLLWEGKTATLMFVRPKGPGAALLLLPPGDGAKRVCWADDGFAAFYKKFVEDARSGKPAVLVSSFALPLKDGGGKVKIKNAKAFESKWSTIVDPGDVKEMLSKETEPTCFADDEKVTLNLSYTYSELTATRGADGWKWTQWDMVSPD
jgi:hypothetical protein